MSKLQVNEATALFKSSIIIDKYDDSGITKYDIQIGDDEYNNIPGHYHCDQNAENHLDSIFQIDDSVITYFDQTTPQYIIGFVDAPKICSCVTVLIELDDGTKEKYNADEETFDTYTGGVTSSKICKGKYNFITYDSPSHENTEVEFTTAVPPEVPPIDEYDIDCLGGGGNIALSNNSVAREYSYTYQYLSENVFLCQDCRIRNVRGNRYDGNCNYFGGCSTSGFYAASACETLTNTGCGGTRLTEDCYLAWWEVGPSFFNIYGGKGYCTGEYIDKYTPLFNFPSGIKWYERIKNLDKSYDAGTITPISPSGTFYVYGESHCGVGSSWNNSLCTSIENINGLHKEFLPSLSIDFYLIYLSNSNNVVTLTYKTIQQRQEGSFDNCCSGSYTSSTEQSITLCVDATNCFEVETTSASQYGGNLISWTDTYAFIFKDNGFFTAFKANNVLYAFNGCVIDGVLTINRDTAFENRYQPYLDMGTEISKIELL